MNDTLIGGSLVLAGVLVTQLVHNLTANKDRKERREKLLREKFEELCESALETTDQVLQMLKLSGPEVISSSPPAAPLRMHYLAMIYFPELRKATREYNNSIVLFYQYLLSSGFDPRIPISIGTQAIDQPKYTEHQNHIVEKRSVLEDAIEKNAEKYTKA